MLQSVLKSKFGYDDFKSDLQKQATTAVHKGFYRKLILFRLFIHFTSQCNIAIRTFFKEYILKNIVLYYQQIFIRFVRKNSSRKNKSNKLLIFRKTRCIHMHADWFRKISLLSITSNNERTKSCNCLFTTFSSHEGILFFVYFIYIYFFYVEVFDKTEQKYINSIFVESNRFFSKQEDKCLLLEFHYIE